METGRFLFDDFSLVRIVVVEVMVVVALVLMLFVAEAVELEAMRQWQLFAAYPASA